MGLVIVIAALVIAGAIVHPAPAAGDLWTVAAFLAVLAFTVRLVLGRGDR